MRYTAATKGTSLYGTEKGRKQPSVKRTYYFKTLSAATVKRDTLKAKGQRAILRLKGNCYKTYRVQVFR